MQFQTSTEATPTAFSVFLAMVVVVSRHIDSQTAQLMQCQTATEAIPAALSFYSGCHVVYM